MSNKASKHQVGTLDAAPSPSNRSIDDRCSSFLNQLITFKYSVNSQQP
jgi:hypothetical protein